MATEHRVLTRFDTRNSAALQTLINKHKVPIMRFPDNVLEGLRKKCQRRNAMIPDIKRILYTSDLSENARFAFGYAASLAHSYDAKITVLHVLEELSPTAMMMVGDIIGEKRWSNLKNEKESNIIVSLRNRLNDFCKEFATDMPSCPFVVENTIVTTGHPVEKILEYAETTDCDMIVMGSHGQGMLSEVMLGSTSRRVLRRCRKPVLVIRLPDDE